MDLIFIYSAFVKGDHTYFEIDSRSEGTQLYPDVKYTTVSEYLDTLVQNVGDLYVAHKYQPFVSIDILNDDESDECVPSSYARILMCSGPFLFSERSGE